LILLVATVLFLLRQVFSGVLWVGSATIPLVFIVVDAETNMPVSGALVQLKRTRDPEYLLFRVLKGCLS
jgi:hypothetical protein